jgi:CDP-diacylglycerol---serine O-phosphatidyltransferase
MNFKKQVPNLFTCANLFCGCIALLAIADLQLWIASYLIFICAILDLLDGMSARVLNVMSPFGKQLDSLADGVSFGVVPAFIMVGLMSNGEPVHAGSFLSRPVLFLPLIIAVFSALRLAKFNIDTRQTNSFLGLPTPSNSIFIASLPLILQNDEFGLSEIILNPYFIGILSIVLSLLLVSEIPLFAVKFKNYSWRDNSYQYILIIAGIILFIILKFAALPVIIIFYILLSLVKNYSDKSSTVNS